MILKICNFKKGIGIESQKTIQASKDQSIETRWNSIVVIEQKFILKAFAISILTPRL